MSFAALGARWRRRIARVTGLEIVWASGNGGYTMCFTTADHEHGLFDLKAWRAGDPRPWTIVDSSGSDFTHFSSCEKLFPGYREQPPTDGLSRPLEPGPGPYLIGGIVCVRLSSGPLGCEWFVAAEPPDRLYRWADFGELWERYGGEGVAILPLTPHHRSTAELREYWTEGPGSESMRSPGWFTRALRWTRRRRPFVPSAPGPRLPTPKSYTVNPGDLDLLVVGDEVRLRLITETGYEVIRL